VSDSEKESIQQVLDSRGNAALPGGPHIHEVTPEFHDFETFFLEDMNDALGRINL
jgi:hypothetical protein